MTYLAINIGNFHPVLVHLPIGIIVFAFVLEIYQRLRPKENLASVIKLALGFGAIAALASIGTGLLLESNGAYDETLLFRHKWMAISLTAVTIFLFFAKTAKQKWAGQSYFPLFITANIMLILAGHWGGSMTHGEDFLTKVNTKEIIIEDVDKALVYNDIVQPIFDRKCVSCHNAKKAEGKLLLTSQTEFLAGGESGSILDSVDAGKPLLAHRMTLPLEDEEHMPPKGKVQLTPNEIDLIHWWLENDNCFNCITSDLERSKKIQSHLNDLEADTSTRALLAKNLEPVPETWPALLSSVGISAYPLKKGSPLYIVNLSNRKDLQENSFSLLEDYAEHIVELNLGNTNFNDTLVPVLSDFENLTKLQLQNTPITDKAMEEVRKLDKLESLNLYGTGVSNAALDVLEQMPSLQDLYLWQTEITDEGINSFLAEHANIAVHTLDEDLFGETELLPPTIIADSDFFKNELKVEMSYPFDDTAIYYTLDGSIPDSTSTAYIAPIVLKNTTNVNAITYKKGWGQSEVVSASYKKSTMDYEGITLNKPPNEKYKAQGGNTLIDLKRGSGNFVDGNWVGYEGTHFNATLALGEKKEVSSVSVGALSAPASWIFYPTGFKVSVSDDGKNFKSWHTEKLPEQKPSSLVEKSFFDLSFPATTAKYVRVEVKSILKNPSWHQNPGGKSWLFVDEIVVN
ncbi:chitobiase/beta-hexosaminidase C-terminal domain-containing protein [Maribacter aestuarii]|uniref:chitobiase/beta-hexosaminidase C-terminal domain-containing protein n=1 Tax=Maribacter aestuarii TaxID=1130723 RepID=UPI0025A5CA7C|nr:chitobiase/beta-hexosaminidase C-terminal domain-containing protein [Maribacter aestuarii]